MIAAETELLIPCVLSLWFKWSACTTPWGVSGIQTSFRHRTTDDATHTPFSIQGHLSEFFWLWLLKHWKTRIAQRQWRSNFPKRERKPKNDVSIFKNLRVTSKSTHIGSGLFQIKHYSVQSAMILLFASGTEASRWHDCQLLPLNVWKMLSWLLRWICPAMLSSC